MTLAATRRDIPGPSEHALLQTAGWVSHPPLQRLEELHRRHGDIFRLEILGPRYRRDRTRWPLSRRTVVVFAAPEQVREILGESGEALRAGEAHEFLEWFLGPRSLMLLDGDEHDPERRQLLTLFAHDRLPNYEAVMRAAVRRAMDRWPTGRPVALGPLVDQALETANLALVFGTADDPDLAELKAAVRRARPAFSAPVLFVPMLRADLGPWSPGGKLRRLQRELREVILRRANQPLPEAPMQSSLLGTLAGMHTTAPGGTDIAHFSSRLVTLLGGLDSTAAALTWTCHHLLRHPQALERASAAARDETDSAPRASAAYLEAACKEALRLHPPFPAVVRRVARPITIGGLAFPPDVFLMPSMHLLHRRAEIYPDPLEFRPERFLERSFAPHEYIPFGAGIRRCLGFAIAPRQMRIVLGEMLRRFDVTAETAPQGIAGRRNVTVVPRDRMQVVLRAR